MSVHSSAAWAVAPKRAVKHVSRRISAALGVSALALLAASPATALPLAYGGLNWDVDRYAPDTVQVLGSQYGRSNVLHVAFGPNGDAANRGGQSSTFYQYQGIQAPTSLPGGTQAFYQVDMWIPSGWQVNIPGGSVVDANPPNNFLATIVGNNTHVDASMWAEIPANAPPGLGAYPTWGYLNDALYSGGSPDAYVFDTETGNLIPRAAGTVNYGAWNTFRMEYRDTQMLFFINDVLAISQTWVNPDITLAGDPANTLKTLFLNHFHYETPGAGGENYNSYSMALYDYWNFFYSNLNYGIITDNLENLSVLLNTNADIEVKNGGDLMVAGGSGTTGAEGNLIVRTGGEIGGGASGNPYLISGNALVEAGGTFGGWVNVAGTVTNLGTISAGNSPGIMNFGAYVAGGAFVTEVQFDNAGLPINGTTHDFINITGNVTGGTTVLNIVPFAPSGAPAATTGNGIELVRVGGGVSPANFALSAPVLQGGFEYLLVHLPDYAGTTDGFFLQSAVRQELVLNAGLLSAGRQSLRACASRSGGMADLSKPTKVWAGAQVGELHAEASTGVKFESDHDCFGGGAYHTVSPEFQVGLSGGFGSTDATLVLVQGMARADGETGVLKASASYVSGTFFANAGLGYASTDWDVVKAAGAGFGEATIDGLIGDLEAGLRTDMGSDAALTVALGLLYDGTECGSDCMLVGATEDPTEWTGRLMGRLDFSWSGGKFRPFVGAAYVSDLGDGNSTAMGNAVFVSDTASGLLEAEAGFNILVNENLTLSARGDYTEGLDSDVNGYHFSAGARLAW